MGGIATDYGQFMKVLLNDVTLKTLMLIPLADQTNFAKLMTNYIMESYTSDAIVLTEMKDKCRLVIRSAPSTNTGNMMVKEENLAIEIYVPVTKDRMPLFERRSNQIVDRLIELFTSKKINTKNIITNDSDLVHFRKMYLEARHELASSDIGFRRMYLQFSYKRCY